jgi:hypothetical protein
MTKICFHCGSNHTIKKGKENRHQRWYCKDCLRYFIGHRRLTKEDVNSAFSSGNLTVSDLAQKFGVPTRTVHRYLSSAYESEVPETIPRKVVVLMDTSYRGRKFGVVIMKDHISGGVLWYKFIGGKETISDYWEGISYLGSYGYEILGLVSDGLTGLREQFQQYKFQHCQFHQLTTVRPKLTLHPKLTASQELLAIAKLMCHTDKESFLGALSAWYEKWQDFISERARGKDGNTHSVHKNTRSAYLSLKRNMPWLWTYYDYPELGLPNTNNEMEVPNSDLKAK